MAVQVPISASMAVMQRLSMQGAEGAVAQTMQLASLAWEAMQRWVALVVAVAVDGLVEEARRKAQRAASHSLSAA